MDVLPGALTIPPSRTKASELSAVRTLCFWWIYLLPQIQPGSFHPEKSLGIHLCFFLAIPSDSVLPSGHPWPCARTDDTLWTLVLILFGLQDLLVPYQLSNSGSALKSFSVNEPVLEIANTMNSLGFKLGLASPAGSVGEHTLNSYDSSMITSSLVCSPRMGRPISAMRLSSSSLLVSGCLSSYSSVKGKGKKVSNVLNPLWKSLDSATRETKKEGSPDDPLKVPWAKPSVEGRIGQRRGACQAAHHYWACRQHTDLMVHNLSTSQSADQESNAWMHVTEKVSACTSSVLRESPSCALWCWILGLFVHIPLAGDQRNHNEKY